MELKEDQNVYLELTNPIHGGEGWDFSEVLWSPVKSKEGKNQSGEIVPSRDIWGVMREPKAGDIIIHSLKRPGKPHRFVGVSKVKTRYNVVDVEPPVAGKWAGYGSYYKIPLQSYSKFDAEMPFAEFLDKYGAEIEKYDKLHPGTELICERNYKKPVQKYLVPVQKEIFKLLNQYFEEKKESLFNNILVQNDDDNEFDNDANDSNGENKRVKTTILRIIRDTKIVNELKQKHDNMCQICGKKIVLPNGNGYSEGHHLKKLGSIHNGPDEKSNIIILCPSHHAEFDYGAIGIDGNNKIVHIDEHNEFHGKELFYNRKDLKKEYLEYHIKNIYNQTGVK